MMAGKVVGFEFEIISKLDSYFLMTVFSSILQALTEVLNKFHFSLQMGNYPIPIADHSGHCLVTHKLTFPFVSKNSLLSFHQLHVCLCTY